MDTHRVLTMAARRSSDFPPSMLNREAPALFVLSRRTRSRSSTTASRTTTTWSIGCSSARSCGSVRRTRKSCASRTTGRRWRPRIHQPPKIDRRAPTEVTQGTDLHRSKIPADDPRLRIDRPACADASTRTPSGLTALLAFALAIVPCRSTRRRNKGPRPEEGARTTIGAAAGNHAPSDVIADARQVPRVMGWGWRPRSHSRTGAGARADDDAEIEVHRAGRGGRSAQGTQRGHFHSGGDDGPLVQQAAIEPLVQSRTLLRRARPATHCQSQPLPRGGDQNRQERKNDFLSRAGVSGGEYLDKGLTLPGAPTRSRRGR